MTLPSGSVETAPCATVASHKADHNVDLSHIIFRDTMEFDNSLRMELIKN